MLGNLLAPEIQSMIAARDFTGLRQVFADWPCADVAQVLADLPVEDQVIVFRVLPQDLAGATFAYLDSHDQKRLLQAMGREDIARVVNQMSPDDRTALLEELPAPAVKELLRLLSPAELKVAQTLLGYPERSVGRLMTPDFIAVKEDWTVQQVLDYVREHGRDSETLNVIYVIDDHGKLMDDVRMREFLLKPLNTKVEAIHERGFIALKSTDLEEQALELFRKYDRTVLPVTDSTGRLVGIVTVDDILDLAERKATEEMHKLGGVTAFGQPYLRISLVDMAKKRAPWLVILFLSEMLTTTAMAAFENEIQRAVVLALFLPLIISSGGNSGSQATTLIIRAMAIGEVRLRDWWRVMRRELACGLILGLVLGVIGFLRISVWSAFSTVYGPHWLLIAYTVSFSLVGVVLWGTISGSMLPFLLRTLKLDPATSSAPFVATLVDVTGLIIYFSIAYLVLKGTLL
jgi:magnesium transporter